MEVEEVNAEAWKAFKVAFKWNETVYMSNIIPREKTAATIKMWQRLATMYAVAALYETQKTDGISRNSLLMSFYEKYCKVILETMLDQMPYGITLIDLLRAKTTQGTKITAAQVWNIWSDGLMSTIRGTMIPLWENILTKLHGVLQHRSGHTPDQDLLELRRHLWEKEKEGRDSASKKAKVKNESSTENGEQDDYVSTPKKSKKDEFVPGSINAFTLEWLPFVHCGPPSPHSSLYSVIFCNSVPAGEERNSGEKIIQTKSRKELKREESALGKIMK